MAKSSAKNRAYLRNIKGQFLSIPQAVAAETASRIFEAAVDLTRLDSGQAVLNWRISVHDGTLVMENPELMWGYGDVQPVPPAGWKGDGGVNEETIRTSMVEQRIAQTAYLETLKGTTISIYNPIAPGAFGSFAPGDDSQYGATAFDTLLPAWDWIQSKAKQEGEAAVAARLPAARAR